MNYVLSLVKEIFKKRKVVWDLSIADFRKRFVGSYFGVVWMLIQPIVTVLIYWFIFGPSGFKSTPPIPNSSYIEWLVPGIAPWFFFSEALNTGTNCLQEYHYLVKKVVFQVEILPILKIMSSLFVHGFFVIIMYGVFLIGGNPPMLTWLQVIYYAFAASMLALAISYLTSAVTVFFKDMAQIVSLSSVWNVDGSDYVVCGNVSKRSVLAGTGAENQSGLLHCSRLQRQYADRQLVLGTADADPVFLGRDHCADAGGIKGV